MGLVDSTNPKTMAENIKKLETMVKTAGSELPTPAAGDAGKVLTVNNDLGYSIASIPQEVPTPGAGDTGKIIKVGSSGYELSDEYSYTLPAISSTETDTGLVFNGDNVYSINLNIDNLVSGDNMITVGSSSVIKNVIFAIARIMTYSDDVLVNEFITNARFWHTTNSVNGIVSASGGQVGGNCVLTVFYTKVTE